MRSIPPLHPSQNDAFVSGANMPTAGFQVLPGNESLYQVKRTSWITGEMFR